MAWQNHLIGLYLGICKHYQYDLWVHAQRFSPNSIPRFSDEEVLTVYLWGVLRGQHKLKGIHTYANDHLRDWFPRLPSYQTFVSRLNRLSPVFAELAMRWESFAFYPGLVESKHIIDSTPIVMARESRRLRAKVSPELANCG